MPYKRTQLPEWVAKRSKSLNSHVSDLFKYHAGETFSIRCGRNEKYVSPIYTYSELHKTHLSHLKHTGNTDDTRLKWSQAEVKRFLGWFCSPSALCTAVCALLQGSKLTQRSLFLPSALAQFTQTAALQGLLLSHLLCCAALKKKLLCSPSSANTQSIKFAAEKNHCYPQHTSRKMRDIWNKELNQFQKRVQLPLTWAFLSHFFFLLRLFQYRKKKKKKKV